MYIQVIVEAANLFLTFDATNHVRLIQLILVKWQLLLTYNVWWVLLQHYFIDIFFFFWVRRHILKLRVTGHQPEARALRVIKRENTTNKSRRDIKQNKIILLCSSQISEVIYALICFYKHVLKLFVRDLLQ